MKREIPKDWVARPVARVNVLHDPKAPKHLKLLAVRLHTMLAGNNIMTELNGPILPKESGQWCVFIYTSKSKKAKYSVGKLDMENRTLGLVLCKGVAGGLVMPPIEKATDETRALHVVAVMAWSMYQLQEYAQHLDKP